jgi:hypothetical protein
MKESLRRIILFTVIVATGSVMIMIDVPLTVLIPLILAVGCIILVLIGAVTPADIRSVFKRPKFQNLKKISFLKRLDEMKFFEKNPQPPNKNPPSPKKEAPAAKGTGKAAPGSPLRSFLSSLGSLGTVLRARSRQKKKVEHINELLDKTVSEKVKSSALASAGVGPGTKPLEVSGGKSAPGRQVQEQDPFMSLSGDEFDVSLLDGLEDTEVSQPPSSPSRGLTSAESEPGRILPEPDITIPSLDISAEAGDILKDHEGGLEEFSGLDGGESLDQDFKDLDNLNLDDVDLDIDLEEGVPEATGNVPGDTAGSVSPPAEAPAVKTAWIPSDAPEGADIAESPISDQADIASFSRGASASDEDMLSSLASDVKQVKKERNLSLLRDLKDFRAPAAEIEAELDETSEWLKNSQSRKVKSIPPAKGMK